MIKIQKLTHVRNNDHLIIAKWKTDNEGGQYCSIKSVDLNKTVRITRNYGFDENSQLEAILDKLGLNFLSHNSNYNQTNYICFKWDMDVLKENFNKKNLDI